MERVTVNETAIAYATYGEGEPLLLIHGAQGSSVEWKPQIEALAGHFRLIVPDVRGHGASAQTSGPYSMELFADDLAALLDALEVESAHVLGHSMGGAVAQSLAARHAGKVRRLILAETNYGFEDYPLLWWITTLSAPAMRLIGVRGVVSLIIKQLGEQDEADKHLLESGFAPQIANPRNFWNIWRANNDYKGKAALAQIKAPTLVMIAARNKITHGMGKRMAKTIPGARLITIPDAGHMLNWDNAGAFNAEVIRFFT
ncbi:MAG: alpha/beta hydrolase [Chloroflexi bacterium]|nr:alpha/beta hydrolase [Chloroflexota bacterium]